MLLSVVRILLSENADPPKPVLKSARPGELSPTAFAILNLNLNLNRRPEPMRLSRFLELLSPTPWDNVLGDHS